MLSREKPAKKDKNAFAIERIPLLQVYFSHFIAKRGTILKEFVLSKVINFLLLVPPVVCFTMDLQTSYLEERYHARIILLLLFTMRVFCIFFPNQFFQKIVFFLRLFVRKSRDI